jgi:very-short-patch-repair endonuclease
MVILMQEITKKIKDEALAKFEPIAIELAKEGKTPSEIAEVFKKHVDMKSRNFYKPHEFFRVESVIKDLKIENNDSKAEAIFYKLLTDNDLKFNFQVEIGSYRVDYLINGNLIVELDGQQHIKERDERRDNYLRKLGYKIIRIPLWVLTIDQKAVVEEIIEASRENWNEKKKNLLNIKSVR